MFCFIKIHINEKVVKVRAIIDTGNFLKEPITKTPVVVVEKQALLELVPNYILNNIDKIINGEDMDFGEYISKVRLIPFSSLRKRKWNTYRG